MRKIVLAFDSFKGCMTAEEACAAAKKGILSVLPSAEVVALPMSDGGEGLVGCISRTIPTTTRSISATGPMGDKIIAQYAKSIDGKTAYMEMAATSGLTLVAPDKRNPMEATTYGVGEMIADAISQGCTDIVIGIGGSATCDGGKGMIEALKDKGMLTNKGKRMMPTECKFIVASDVSNPLYGTNGAAYMFAPQKGATPQQVELLDQRLRQFAHDTELQGIAPSSVATMPGTGAAGGLGYALLAYLKAHIASGIEIMIETVGFDHIAHDADLVITGEGKSDMQTMMGKVAYGVMQRCKRKKRKVWLVSGAIDDKEGQLTRCFDLAVSINEGDKRPLSILMQKQTAMDNLQHTMQLLLSENRI